MEGASKELMARSDYPEDQAFHLSTLRLVAGLYKDLMTHSDYPDQTFCLSAIRLTGL